MAVYFRFQTTFHAQGRRTAAARTRDTDRLQQATARANNSQLALV